MEEYDLSDDLDVKLEPPESPDCPDDIDPWEFRLFGGGDCSPDSGDTDFCTSSTLYIGQDGGDGKEDGPKRMCLVCGDIASGLHYGVASCEACKAFFKRTVQGCIEYACPASGSCEITKRRRKACQACRFQKCLYMGMLKEGVRRDRVRGGRQKYKRSLDFPPVVMIQHQSKQIGVVTQYRRMSSNEAEVKIKSEPCTVKPEKKFEGKLLAALQFIEPEKVYAMPEPSLSDDEYKLMVTLSDLTDRELVATIGWAKQVPGFASLPLPDQMSLLHGTWLDIVCLNVAFRSVPYNGNIFYADDFKVSEEDSAVYGMPRELDRVTRRLVMKLTELKVTREEYVLLKAMLLFNSDTNLECLKGVQQQRDRVYDALVEYEGPRGASLPKRVSELLFILPLIVHNKFVSREFWLAVRQDGRVVLHKLLREMLEYAFS